MPDDDLHETNDDDDDDLLREAAAMMAQLSLQGGVPGADVLHEQQNSDAEDDDEDEDEDESDDDEPEPVPVQKPRLVIRLSQRHAPHLSARARANSTVIDDVHDDGNESAAPPPTSIPPPPPADDFESFTQLQDESVADDELAMGEHAIDVVRVSRDTRLIHLTFICSWKD